MFIKKAIQLFKKILRSSRHSILKMFETVTILKWTDHFKLFALKSMFAKFR